MRFKVDWTSVRGAARTAGALMIGNVFVSVFLLGNRHWLDQAELFALGGALIIATSVERKD